MQGRPTLTVLQVEGEGGQGEEGEGGGRGGVVGRPVESTLPIHVCQGYVSPLQNEMET